MLNKIFRLCLVIIFCFYFQPILTVQANPSVSADQAILINQETGEILFEKNANQQQLIASITKIMTAIIAIESTSLSEMVKVPQQATLTEGSSIYLEAGEQIPLEDLIYGLMLRSGNDAAMSIAEHVGESVEGFVFLMNEKAKWLGMDNTHFDNPHGLDSETHYSSAKDMANLMRYAMLDKQFRKITGAKSYRSSTRTYDWVNKNKLLTSYYEDAIGGKTGYTRAAGRTFVSVAERDGIQLIAVTINDPNDWQDHMSLYNWGFDKLNQQETLSPLIDNSEGDYFNQVLDILTSLVGLS
ncbi:serine hydrolase [Amphibacillus marinus]